MRPLSAPHDVAPPQFRELLGRFATGVTVLTARDTAGEPIGMTANSLASVSLDPPLLSVCIEQAATVHQALLESERFVVNVLSHTQEEISRRFAGPESGRFDGVGYHDGDGGGPLLEGAIAHIECLREAVYPAGDHSILVGRVVGGTAGDGRPLLYFRGGYGTLG